METQKVILPFFYALFLPDFPQENESDSRPTENNEKSHSQPIPQITLEKNKITPNNFLFIQSHKKSQNKAEVPFPPHSGIPLITLITYIDV